MSDDASAETIFRFENLVGYSKGEYSLHLITNCQSYTVWIARMGGTDVVSGELVRTQAYDGVLHKSPNDSTWIADPDADFMFEIGTANFVNNAQIRWNSITGVQANMLVTAVTQFVGEDVVLNWSYSLDGGGSWTSFRNKTNTELGTIATQLDLQCDVTGSGSTFQIAKSGAGIILLLNDLSADYVSFNAETAEPCNKVTMIVPLAVDGVNGAGTRTVIPYYSVDDGKTWVELKVPAGYEPVDVDDGTFREWRFQDTWRGHGHGCHQRHAHRDRVRGTWVPEQCFGHGRKYWWQQQCERHVPREQPHQRHFRTHGSGYRRSDRRVRRLHQRRHLYARVLHAMSQPTAFRHK